MKDETLTEQIATSYTASDLRNTTRMKNELAYLGLEDEDLAVLLREARHWRSGSKLRLAHLVRAALRDEAANC